MICVFATIIQFFPVVRADSSVSLLYTWITMLDTTCMRVLVRSMLTLCGDLCGFNSIRNKVIAKHFMHCFESYIFKCSYRCSDY